MKYSKKRSQLTLESFIKILYEMVVVKSKRETHEAMGNSHINSASDFIRISSSGSIHLCQNDIE
jgi:hypothetical protein